MGRFRSGCTAGQFAPYPDCLGLPGPLSLPVAEGSTAVRLTVDAPPNTLVAWGKPGDLARQVVVPPCKGPEWRVWPGGFFVDEPATVFLVVETKQKRTTVRVTVNAAATIGGEMSVATPGSRYRDVSRHHRRMRTAHPSVVGVVEAWHNEDGWGVLRTPDGLSVWCHFSQVDVDDGYRELTAGEQLRFDYETPGQDGCDGRVLTSAQPLAAGGAAVVREPLPPSGMPGAYASHLVITFDEE